MPFIFFNSHEAAALNVKSNTNFYFQVKGRKNVTEYIPKPSPAEIDDSDRQVVNDDEIKDSNSDNVGLESIDDADDIEVLLEDYKDDIESEDLDEGLKLMEKVDLDYLLSFDRENLTPVQKQEIKDYLRSKLTDDEYTKVIELIGKYIGLIQ